MKKEESFIFTYTGKKFYLFEPKEEDICIEDIAHSLSTSMRANGHYQFPYSVAQHTMFAVDLAREHEFENDILLKIYLHDFSESYVGDLTNPLKVHLKMFSEVEDNIQKIVHEKFNVPYPTQNEHDIIKYFDVMAFEIESYHLLGNKSSVHKEIAKNKEIKYEHWEDVKERFIHQFNELYWSVNPR